jgi:hypothetical protein
MLTNYPSLLISIIQGSANGVSLPADIIHFVGHVPRVQGCLLRLCTRQVCSVNNEDNIYSFIFRARAESNSLPSLFKQKLPSNVTEEDIMSFDMRKEFRELRVHTPLLMHTVAGSMNITNTELKVNRRDVT